MSLFLRRLELRQDILQTFPKVRPEGPTAFRLHLLTRGEGILYVGPADTGSSQSSDIEAEWWLWAPECQNIGFSPCWVYVWQMFKSERH